MKSVRIAVFAGGAALALAGIIGAAQAQTRPVVVALTPVAVALPGGEVVEFLATGPVPPQVVVEQAAPAMQAPAWSGPASPFAMLDRISAEMDRQQEAMLREVQALAQMPPSAGMSEPAAFGNLPPGVSGYSMVSTFSGNGVCTQTVQITYTGNGARPQMVSSHSGDCGTTPAAPATQPTQPSSRPSAPGTLLVKNGGQLPATHLVRPVADWNG